jgi:hypothetical protein
MVLSSCDISSPDDFAAEAFTDHARTTVGAYLGIYIHTQAHTVRLNDGPVKVKVKVFKFTC